MLFIMENECVKLLVIGEEDEFNGLQPNSKC
jgi:hypothetical protein